MHPRLWTEWILNWYVATPIKRMQHEIFTVFWPCTCWGSDWCLKCATVSVQVVFTAGVLNVFLLTSRLTVRYDFTLTMGCVTNIVCVLLIVFTITTSANDNMFTTSNLVVGKKLSGNLLVYIIQVSVKRCWKECSNRQKCRSFNYARSSHLCELNTAEKSSTVELTDSPGYYYGDDVQQVGNYW